MREIVIVFIAALIVIAIIVVIAAYFYRRSTQEVSLVRTGIGGRKVVMDSGCLVIPYFHDVARVNMQTLRLEVRRKGEDALITKDRLRVDVGAEFYVSVGATEDSIARASQTLGERTFHADKLRELIEGKLLDALRAVAARMSMDDLHEKRAEFVTEVGASLNDTLNQNGLMLESVSLSSLDQTPFTALDENNAFNAVGMRKLAEVIAKSKKERAEIDSDAEVSVHRSSMEASKRKLEIDLEQQEAQIKQAESLETMKAAQLAEVASRKAESEVTVNEARIRMEQNIRAADIAREKVVREAEIAQVQALEIAEQERSIVIANKTCDQSKALAQADMARVEVVKAAEAIATARVVAEAQRQKDVAILNAQQLAEVSTRKLVNSAKAEAEASVENAKATLQNAKAEAEAAKLRIATLREKTDAKAKGKKALNDADNVLNKEIVALKADLARLKALPKVVKQMVKPAKKIDSIRIHQISGGGLTGSGSNKGSKPPVNQVLDSIMEMAVQLPALKKIGKELGLSVEKGLKRKADKDEKVSGKSENQQKN
jgi:flotillin